MGKNSYDLSIIIPIRNTPFELISRCLRSVFQAIYNGKNFSTKVILIDDFSSYAHYVNYSRLILQKYPNILLKRTNTCLGIGRARNYGASLIRSRYLLFIDSDDIVSEKLIMRLLPNSTEKGICFANHIKVLSKKIKKYDKRIFTEILNIFPRQFDSPFLYTNFIGMPAIIPKKLFVKVRGYAEGIYSGEHISLWGKLYLRGLLKEIKYIDEILYEYHPHKKGNCLKDIVDPKIRTLC